LITTVCMNPSFDKTAVVEKLVPGSVNRLKEVRYDVGGKGLNVAIVLKRFGEEANCVGCAGESNEREWIERVNAQGIPFLYLSLPGSTRTNLKILDMENNVVTEFNEPGLTMEPDMQAKFIVFLKQKAQHSQYVVLSGSLPIGCNEYFYRDCMRAVQGIPCVLDTSGEALMQGLSEKPFIIKPNLPELEEIMKRELKTLRAIRDAAMEMVQEGAQNVIVSMGKYGAIYTNGEHTFFAPAVSVQARSTVGAGDAMLGGVLMGLVRGETMATSLRYGVAAGGASVITEGTQLLTVQDFEELLPKVTLQEL
jgi:1-phosphofructokinase